MTISRLPRPDQYQLAIQNPRTAFNDADLKNGRVETDPLGLPVVASGGFAIAYKITSPSDTWAVRCFHKTTAGLPDLQERYQAISSFLKQHPSRYFVESEYQERGIRVAGGYAPITKMAWIDGDPLNLFIEKNISCRQPIGQLASKFVGLVYRLEALGVAHGDLQHGNLLVTNAGFKLVDYDGMFVPALAGRKSNELGHPNYQHPLRRETDFNAQIDRFASIVIYIALTAIMAEPDLWKRYSAGGESLLFQQKDFIDPARSKLFADLERIPAVSRMATDFRSICMGSLSAVPRLEDFSNASFRPAPVQPPSTSRPTLIRRPYEVISADATGSLRERLGQRVEVVGMITSCRPSRTYDGRPCMFLNFGDWRNRCFSLVLWSEALTLFHQADIDPRSFEGHWVSVTGVVESYRGSPRIVIKMPSEIEVLSGQLEAKERLACSPPGPSASPVFILTDLHRTSSQASSTAGQAGPNKSISVRKDRDHVLTDLYRDFPGAHSSSNFAGQKTSASRKNRGTISSPAPAAPSAQQGTPKTPVTSPRRAPVPPGPSAVPKPAPPPPPPPAGSHPTPTDQQSTTSKSLLDRFLDWFNRL